MPALHAVCVVLQSHLQALTARRVHAVQAGGAIYVGLPAFNPNPSCDEASAVAGAAVVRLSGGALRGNLAAGSGGGAHLAAGHLEMQARLAGTGCGRWPGPGTHPPTAQTATHYAQPCACCSVAVRGPVPGCSERVYISLHISLQGVALAGNRAGTDGDGGGVGGGISVSERCSAAGCEAVSARLLGLTLTANSAGLAGGALFFNATNPSSWLELRHGSAAPAASSPGLMPDVCSLSALLSPSRSAPAAVPG